MRAWMEVNQFGQRYMAWLLKVLWSLLGGCILGATGNAGVFARRFAFMIAAGLALMCFSNTASASFTCSISISTNENTQLTYDFTNPTDEANCDPGFTYGIYSDTSCNTSLAAHPTTQGGTVVIDSAHIPDRVIYTPKTDFAGTDTFTFYTTNDGVNCWASTATVTVSGPAVTSVSPTSGAGSGGTSVTITGTGFTGATAVLFGASSVSPSSVSATSITVTSPAHAAGVVDVKVTTPLGNSLANASDHFTYLAAPTVTSVSPTSGPIAGSTSVTVTGTNFTGATAVSFGGTAAASYTVNSATSISATSPAHAAGAVDITVTTSGGTSATSGSDQFTFVTPAVANAVSQTVAHGSSSNSITLNITGGAATSVAVSTAASHGTATAAGTAITYTPTASYSGTDTFAYTATNAAGTSSPATATITISPPTMTYAPSSPAGGTADTAYSQSLASASGGTSPYTYTVASGSLPTGITLASNGTLSGTPTAGGTFNFTVTATDSSTGTGPFSVTSGTLSLVIGAPTISVSPTTVTAATVASAYSTTISASGGTSSYSFAITAGSLPAGLSLNSGTGVLSGTPTAGGTFNFTVTATDSSTGTGPFTGSRAYTLSVNAPTLALSPAGGSLTGTAETAYSQAFTGSAGTAPYTYSLSINSGIMPTGLSFSTSTGVLSGTPTTANTVNFTVTATDSSTGTGPYSTGNTYTLTVSSPTISVSPGSLTNPTVGGAYSQTVSASGGVAAYTFAVSVGSLPTGLSLNSSTGVISGTPTAGGTFNFTIRATDADSFTGTRAYSVTVAAPTITLSPTTVSAATVGSAYSTTVSATGGTASYSYAITAGALPAGVSLNSGTGVISGTPTAAGTFNFTVTATDSSTGSGPFTGSRAYTLTVNAPTLAISPISGTSLTGSVSTAYSQTFTASNGTAPYTYALTVNSGTMPTGLSFSTSTGVLSGTPTTAGSVNFTVTGTDSSTGTGAPFSVAGTYTLTTSAPTISVSPSTLPTPVIGTAYSQTVSGSGGTAPYTFAVVAGSLPTGLSLNTSTGVVSGTPTAGGAYGFTIKATDANTFNASRAYSGTIAAATVVVTPATLPAGQVGVAYSQTASASGGTAPYTYTISVGALPTGITLNASTGVISGTPTVANTYNFTVKATDSSTGTAAPYSGTLAYSLVINPLTPIAGAKSVTVAYNTATPIDLSTVITGGAATSVAIAGAASHGTTSVSGTTVTYTPTSGYIGTDSFTYTATNTGGTSATATVSITVTPQTPAAGTKSVTTAFNTAIGIDLSTVISGGAATSVTIGTATTHGTTSVSGTTVTYTPTTGYSGADSFTYTATNTGGTSAAATVSITVNPQAPVAGAVSASVGYNSSNNAITLALTGGAAASVAVPTAPAHGTVSISGTAISYTPTAGYVGADSFTYTATNAGGTSAPATVSLTVKPQIPVAAAVAATVAFNSNNNAITLSLSGGVATSVAVPSGPSHGTVTITGTAITYTPTTGYYGTDSFTYTATNAGGTSAAATVSITVNPMLPVAQPVSTTVTNNSTNNVIPLVINGGPAVSIAILNPPQHGTVVVSGAGAGKQGNAGNNSGSGLSISYTPTPGYTGPDSFTYTASNAAGTSAGAMVSLQVTPPGPGVATVTATTTAGTPVTLAVTAQATGAPFTGLSIVTQPANGTAVVQGLNIVYTSTPTFAGTASIVYSLSNAYGSTQGTATVTVTGRLDPSKDAEVNGLLAAEAEATRRFATAQLSNFNRRLESLHGDGWGKSDFGLSVNSFGLPPKANTTPATGTPTAERPVDADQVSKSTWQSTPAGGRRGKQIANASADDSSKSTEQAGGGTPNERHELSFWVNGGLDFGQRDAITGQERFRFQTDGVSLGADYRVNDLFSVGVGAGLGHDVSDVGSNGSKSRGDSTVLAVYGTLRPAEHLFIDGVLGYGALSFDLDRFITDTGGFATGHRSGKQVFGSLAGGYEYRDGALLLSPYGRLEVMSATLKGYTETAAGTSALTYNDQTVRMTTGKLGVRAETGYDLSFGKLKPRMRIEYQHHFEGADNATMNYADLAALGPVYSVSPAQAQRNSWVAEVGGKLQMRGDISFSLDYGSTLNNDTGHEQSIRLGLEVRF